MARRRPARTYHDDSAWPHLRLGPHDDRRYVEQLIKAIFQAGLSWPVIESHWPAFGEVFHDFDPVQVAAMTGQDINRAAQDPRIMRNHRKVQAAVTSAAAVNQVIAQYGSFDAYLRSFGSPEEEIADLQHRFAGLGDYSAWWFMQSVGLPVPPVD
jgi:3-methyladenine DNA glycosylase Tag